jgi:hypothetical protein
MATLKEITHDSSTTLSDFYNTIFDPDGAYTVTPAAALNGTTNGVEADYDAGTQNARIEESFASIVVTQFRWRFRVDLDGMSNAASSSDCIDILLTDGGTASYVFEIVGDGVDGFELQSRWFSDSGGDTQLGINVALPSGDVCIECKAIRETTDGDADGVIEFFINGASQASISNADNFNKFSVDESFIRIRSNVAAFTGTLKYDEFLLTDVAGTSLCAATLGLAAMTKPADIDAAGTFIYAALLQGGTPIISKISTDLDADGTTVFDPSAGDNIGVECGRFSSDTIWVAGNFDGTNVIEKSEDAGDSFTVKDDATIGDIRSFVIGPDSDERILVFDETNGDILETNDDGASWKSINASVTPEINAIARLGENVQESAFGNDGGANNSINYSVNSGDDLENFQTGVYPNANATRVIVN